MDAEFSHKEFWKNWHNRVVFYITSKGGTLHWLVFPALNQPYILEEPHLTVRRMLSCLIDLQDCRHKPETPRSPSPRGVTQRSALGVLGKGLGAEAWGLSLQPRWCVRQSVGSQRRSPRIRWCLPSMRKPWIQSPVLPTTTTGSKEITKGKIERKKGERGARGREGAREREANRQQGVWRAGIRKAELRKRKRAGVQPAGSFI